MSCELTLDDVVTEFLINSCRLCPPSRNLHAVNAAFLCFDTVLSYDEVDTELIRIPLTTGSVAEFYIEPILPYLGDIDVMYHCNTELAIPRGHPPPTQLPAEFHNYVKVYEIIDSHLPGYVYLELRYLLTECSDTDNYDSVEYDRGRYFANSYYSGDADVHGPAVIFYSQHERVDRVSCVKSARSTQLTE